jgi:hypothetical protein
LGGEATTLSCPFLDLVEGWLMSHVDVDTGVVYHRYPILTYIPESIEYIVSMVIRTDAVTLQLYMLIIRKTAKSNPNFELSWNDRQVLCVGRSVEDCA